MVSEIEPVPEEPKEKIIHPFWPAPGDHLLSAWNVRDKTSHYRWCLHPLCKYFEVKAVI